MSDAVLQRTALCQLQRWASCWQMAPFVFCSLLFAPPKKSGPLAALGGDPGLEKGYSDSNIKSGTVFSFSLSDFFLHSLLNSYNSPVTTGTVNLHFVDEKI